MPFILILCLSLWFPIFGNDLGTLAYVYPIQEKNILEFIQERLAGLSEEEKTQLNSIFGEYIQAVKNPKSLSLKKATKSRTFYFDPAITVKVDVKDNKGNIIVAKGSSYNALDTISLSQNLLFFDGTDPIQLKWAQAQPGVWILTKGKPLELEEIENKPIYFDQYGFLSKKIGIECIPARISQSNKLLKIEEIVLEEV